MKTRFGSTVIPIRATGEGWMIVRTEDDQEREWHHEWHIAEMIIEEVETPEARAVIDKALEESAEAAT